MRNKLFGLALSALSIAIVGFTYTDAQAKAPEQVGSAPICKAEAIGKRGSTSIDLASDKAKNLAFTLNNQGTAATVAFKVTGPKNCKVRLSTNSLYAPALNGKPWSSQKLHSRNTKIFTPGQYTMRANVPSQKKYGMCFYQVDITYGTRNQLPVIAYAHGEIAACKKTPTASCDNLQAVGLSDTRYRLIASATAKDGAKINSYTFTISKDGKQIYATTQKSNKLIYNQTTPGTYTAQVTANTTINKKTNAKCRTTFTVPTPEKPTPKTPGISIEKTVDGADYKRIETNVEFTYSITVKNTGEIDLKDVVVTDSTPDGVTFLEASAGTISQLSWTHTVSHLKVGESQTFTIKAVVADYIADDIKNTACVNAPEVNPENPDATDDCDDATVVVPPPAKPEECRPGIPVGDNRCEETAPKDDTPRQLPETGPAEAIVSLVGVGSLIGSLGYYIASRRTLG